MKKNFKPNCWMYPMPVLVVGTYGSGRANAMTAAWGILCGMTPPCLELNLDAGHKTVANIRETMAFTASPATEATLAQADYVGIVHGHKVDKTATCGLHPVRSQYVNAPLFEELPMSLECRVKSVENSCDCVRVVAEIVNISVDDSILAPNGAIDPAKLRPISLDPVNRTYLSMGAKVGNAYSDGKKYIK